jgi:hypothetical protein
VLEGLALLEADAVREIEMIEVFPAASSTRRLGRAWSVIANEPKSPDGERARAPRDPGPDQPASTTRSRRRSPPASTRAV